MRATPLDGREEVDNVGGTDAVGPAVASAGGRGRLAAVGVLAAVGLAAAAQWRIEAAGAGASEVPLPVVLLFVVAIVIAVASTRGRSGAAIPATPFRVEQPAYGWLAALAPGLACLVAAAWLHALPGYYPVHPLTSALWLAGIGLLLGAGAAQHLDRRRTRPAADGPSWSGGRVALCIVGLVALSMALRTVLGIAEFPGFVDRDEGWTGFAAREILAGRLHAFFGLWWVGVPNLGLLPARIAELVLGESLHGIRLGNALLGTVGVVCLYDTGRRLIGELPAVAAAALLATAHVYLHWSRNGQHFVLTPVGGAVILCLLVRAWTGGSLLAWVGAGVALGLATQTYQASYVLPLVVLVTGAGWTWFGGAPRRGAVVAMLVILTTAGAILAPIAITMYRARDWAMNRPASLMVLEPQNMADLGARYGEEEPTRILLEHGLRTLAVFNFGDDFYVFGQRPLADAVTAAVVPLAAAMLLARLTSPLGWLFWTWVPCYLALGVFGCGHPPTHHRIVIVLVPACLAVIWAVGVLARTVRDGLGLPRATVGLAVLGFTLAAAAANVWFYFVTFRAVRPTDHIAGFTRIACGYAGSRVILDATVLDGWEYVPAHNNYLAFECPDARRVRIEHERDLWQIDRLTIAQRAVLIVPLSVVDRNPGQPEGYRVTRRYVDRRILSPVPLPLAVYELERRTDRAAGPPAG